jgi:YD repeat-containing protein
MLSIVGSAAGQLGQVKTGIPPFNSFGGGPFDTINLGNLNVHFAVPIVHKAGRGIPFDYDLTYDNSVWYPVGSSGNQVWTPVTAYGWQGLSPAGAESITYTLTNASGNCGPEGQNTWQSWEYSNFVYKDKLGVNHSFSIDTKLFNSPNQLGCPPNGPEPATAVPTTAADGSGYTMTVIPGTNNASVSLTRADGTAVTAPVISNPSGQQGNFSQVDRNGNENTGSNGSYTDTLGTNVLNIAGTAPSNTTLTYTGPSGNATYSVSYTTYTVATNFGVSGIHEAGATAVSLVDKITMPDNATLYQFTYEQTPPTPASGACTPLANTFSSYCVTARVASVALPQGGQISYTYTGGSNGVFNDGSASGLTRVVNPGGTWSYARSQVSGSHWQTTVSDPMTPSNQSVIDFQQDGGGSGSFFETQRLTYTGSSSTGTLLGTIITCYNGNSSTPANCPTTAVSAVSGISESTVFTYLPKASGQQAETDTLYNPFGQPTTVTSYDFGTGQVGPKLQSVVTTYGTFFNNASLPSSVVVNDGSGNPQATTTIQFDQQAATSTTGTPQHVTITGQPGLTPGNATQVATQVSGSVTLYRRYTYYDTGNLKTTTDTGLTTAGGPNITTYNYDNTGSPSHSCGNSFVTSISEPLTLSRSMAWNCSGGLQTSVTDENGQVVNSTYTDPFYWRAAQVKDQLGNITSITYPSLIAAESTLTFNASKSVFDRRLTLDGFGRMIVSQSKQGPTSTNYDSVETDYDPVGRVGSQVWPYTAAAGTLCSGTCSPSTNLYDGMGRPSSVTDVGGRITTTTYAGNDVLQVIGPKPTNENTKQKQLEYDGLGRLKSVCEMSSTSSGTCGQTTQATGFWTKYTYDTLGNLKTVTQNAQAVAASQQGRSYTWDMLSRVTSEQNPESGSVNYYYDSLASGDPCGAYTSAGDLVKKIDNMGNVTCYKYMRCIVRPVSPTPPARTRPTRPASSTSTIPRR